LLAYRQRVPGSNEGLLVVPARPEDGFGLRPPHVVEFGLDLGNPFQLHIARVLQVFDFNPAKGELSADRSQLREELLDTTAVGIRVRVMPGAWHGLDPMP
jgi:hypothetical protein